MKRAKANYLIQSVVHGLNLLEEFRGDQSELGVTELSNRLNLHKNNVFRLLATLETKGYIEQNRITENYRLGIKALQLGQVYVRQSGFLQQARPILQSLVDETQETALVGVAKNQEVVYLDGIESPQSVRVVNRIGQHAPIHATATGKCWLAACSEEEFERHVPSELTACTPNTIVDRRDLRKHLRKVEQQGYALENEEFEKDVRCIATPVLDYTRKVVGAVSIAGPTFRMTDDRIKKELLPTLRQASERLSRRLGYEASLLAAG